VSYKYPITTYDQLVKSLNLFINTLESQKE